MNHRVLLVNPPAEVVRECYDTPDYPHIGLAYVAGYLKTHGLDVKVIDGKLARLTVEQTVQGIVSYHPRILGLTAMTHMITTAAKIARAVRAACPDTVIVLGGFHGSFLPERTLREFPPFDYLIVGEGEMAFLDFVRAVFADEDPAGVQGVASRIPDGDRSTPRVRLHNANIGKMLRDSNRFAPLVNAVAQTVADQIGDDAFVEHYTTDRNAAAVVGPAELQARDGALTRAAAALGLEVRTKI